MSRVAVRDGSRSSRVPRSDARRNESDLLRAATAAIHREGLKVPLGTVAADAGVGIGTLYRHFPTRDHLLSALTHRSFEQVLVNAEQAERLGTTPLDAVRRFVEAAIAQRRELVLPLHGGPPVTDAATLAVRAQVWEIVERIFERGRADGSVRSDVTTADVVAFAAMLAQPREPDPAWDDRCRRLLGYFLDGLAVSGSDVRPRSGGGG